MHFVLIFQLDYVATYVLTFHLNYVGNATLIMHAFDATNRNGGRMDEKMYFAICSRNATLGTNNLAA